MRVSIKTVGDVIEQILARLRDQDVEGEQLTFALAHVHRGDSEVCFEAFDQRVVGEHEFRHRSSYHLELGDEARVSIMREAQQRNAALVEFHSHTFDEPACFSPSDFLGFDEFVPYAWWRLRAPYAAIVVGPSSLDGLAWLDGPSSPYPVAHVHTRTETLRCTQMSLRKGVR